MPTRLVRSTIVMLVILLIPVVPFILFGEHSEAWIQQRVMDSTTAEQGGWVTVLTIICALVADILLPVPSSGVMTFAGAAFGIVPGALLGWLGLTISCLLGYWLGHRFGMPLISRIATQEEILTTSGWLNSFGRWLLAAVRGLPVLAEASVLLAGAYRMEMKNFWPPVLLANLVIALVYSALGYYAMGEGWLGAALAVSVLLPLILLLLWLVVVPKNERGADAGQL